MKFVQKLIFFLALVQSAMVFAAGQPFTQSQFDALMKEGKPVVVHVHAPWCTNCKAQDPILNAEIKSPAYAGVTFLQVDFDTQKATLKLFNVSVQSTILVFKQGKKVGRATGNTRQKDIEELTQKAL